MKKPDLSEFYSRAVLRLPVIPPPPPFEIKVETQQTLPTPKATVPLALPIEEDEQQGTSGPAPPELTRLIPGTVATEGGDLLTLIGKNFDLDQTYEVWVGDVQATDVSVISSLVIHATTPAHDWGEVDVYVKSKTTDLESNKLSLLYQIRPRIGSISPNSGPTAGGTSVTITTNTSLQDPSRHGQPGDPLGWYRRIDISFGGSFIVATITSDHTLTVVTPAHAAGAVDITIKNNYGLESTLPNGFTYGDGPPPPPPPPTQAPPDGFNVSSSGPPDRPFGWHYGETKVLTLRAVKNNAAYLYTGDIQIYITDYSTGVGVNIFGGSHMVDGLLNFNLQATYNPPGGPGTSTGSFVLQAKDVNSSASLYGGFGQICGVSSF